MSILNTLVGGGGNIPEFAWIEYKVNTNSWTTTEWVAVNTSVTQSSVSGISHDYNYYIVVGSGYKIDGSGNFTIENTRTIYTANNETITVNGWVRDSSNPKRIELLSEIVFGKTNIHTSGKENTPYTEHWGRALTTSSKTVPHTSTTVDWNTIVRIHLTEQIGEQFKKYPLTN